MKYILIDTLNRIKNAALKNHTYVNVKYSNFVLVLLSLLKKESIILDYIILNNKEIQVFLSSIKFNIKNISTPKKKLYSSYKNIKKVLPNFDSISDILILNTVFGLQSYNSCLDLKIGGELLFQITINK